MESQSDTVYGPLMLVTAESKTGLSREKLLPLCCPTQMLVVLLCAYRYRCIWYITVHVKLDTVHCLRLPGTA